MNVVVRDVLADLECSVCREVMHPPIRMCILGHSFGNDCCKKLTTCPVCRSEIGIARNYSLEQIHNKLTLPCKNSENCRFEALGFRLRDHEKFCLYTEKQCLLTTVDGCTWRGLMKDFADHCQEHHSSNVFKGTKLKFLWPNFLATMAENIRIQQFRVVFNAHDKLFKCVWDVNLEFGYVRWYVGLIGTKQEAKGYTYTMRVMHGKNQNETMTAQGICQAFSRRGCCYDMDEVETVGKFCCKRGHLRFSIEIEKLEGNVVEEDEGWFTPETSTFVDSHDPALDKIRRCMVRKDDFTSCSESDSDYDDEYD